VAVAVMTVWALGPPAAIAAEGPVRVDAATEVRAIRFHGANGIPARDLRDLLETRDRGAAYGLRVALGKLPFIGPPAPRYFSPLGLQRDVVRIRQHYRDAGYLAAEVRYAAELDERLNLLTITIEIEEGPRTRIVGAAVGAADGAALAVPDSLERRWRPVARSVERLRGRALDRGTVGGVAARVRRWWQDHGHPWASVEVETEADSVRHEATVRFVVESGPPARFGEITVAGNTSISERTVRRELPFERGDPYSAADLSNGRLELQQLEIVRTASFDLAGADSVRQVEPEATVPVQVNLYEARPRHVGGDVGYGTDAGFAAEARWGHRNFTGAGRTLTLAAGAQTGYGALTDDPDKRYRASVSLLQPYLFHRWLSGVLSPFVEYRNDSRDRSLEAGTNATLVLRAAPERTVSLDYRLARRRIYEYRLEDLSKGGIDLLTLLALISQGYLDSLGTTRRSGVVTLSGNVGTLDQPANPHRGVLLQPTVQVTTPPGANSTEYCRLDATAHMFVPLRRTVLLYGRAGVGRLFPFGRSEPADLGQATFELLELRDVLETAGGSGDVRGWGARMLGPKFPDVRFVTQGDSIALDAEGYVPIGGLSRATFSLELRLPFPGLGPQFGTHAFLDGGRVWTDDSRFTSGPDPYGQEDWFYAAGGGVDLRTPVGPIRLSIGYKLNPSLTDLVDADDFVQALLEDRPVDTLKRHDSRRWQFHLAIGSGF